MRSKETPSTPIPHPRDNLSIGASPDDELLLAFRQGKLLGLKMRKRGEVGPVRVFVPYSTDAEACAYENGFEVGFCKESPKSQQVEFKRRRKKPEPSENDPQDA